MPQSLSAVYLHLVFSTKERRPWLRNTSLRRDLHAYLGGISKRLDCTPLQVGGVEDHVHLLCRFGRTLSLAKWVKELKRASHLWLDAGDKGVTGFEWQGGYSVFSVSATRLEGVRRYIEDQEAHHQRQSFQDEVRSLLRKHGMEFDERYLWD